MLFARVREGFSEGSECFQEHLAAMSSTSSRPAGSHVLRGPSPLAHVSQSGRQLRTTRRTPGLATAASANFAQPRKRLAASSPRPDSTGWHSMKRIRGPTLGEDSAEKANGATAASGGEMTTVNSAVRIAENSKSVNAASNNTAMKASTTRTGPSASRTLRSRVTATVSISTRRSNGLRTTVAHAENGKEGHEPESPNSFAATQSANVSDIINLPDALGESLDSFLDYALDRANNVLGLADGSLEDFAEKSLQTEGALLLSHNLDTVKRCESSLNSLHTPVEAVDCGLLIYDACDDVHECVAASFTGALAHYCQQRQTLPVPVLNTGRRDIHASGNRIVRPDASLRPSNRRVNGVNTDHPTLAIEVACCETLRHALDRVKHYFATTHVNAVLVFKVYKPDTPPDPPDIMSAPVLVLLFVRGHFLNDVGVASIENACYVNADNAGTGAFNEEQPRFIWNLGAAIHPQVYESVRKICTRSNQTMAFGRAFGNAEAKGGTDAGFHCCIGPRLLLHGATDVFPYDTPALHFNFRDQYEECVLALNQISSGSQGDEMDLDATT